MNMLTQQVVKDKEARGSLRFTRQNTSSDLFSSLVALWARTSKGHRNNRRTWLHEVHRQIGHSEICGQKSLYQHPHMETPFKFWISLQTGDTKHNNSINALGNGAKTSQCMEKIVDRCTFITGCMVHSGEMSGYMHRYMKFEFQFEFWPRQTFRRRPRSLRRRDFDFSCHLLQMHSRRRHECRATENHPRCHIPYPPLTDLVG